MGLKEDAAAILAALEEKGRRRGHRRVTGAVGAQAHLLGGSAARELVHNFSSNDYLGLAGDERLQDAAIEVMRKSGVGSTASRLILSHSAHDELEEELACWLGVERVQLFGSGYAANVGVVSTLAGPGDVVLSDQLNHASMIDGCRLSRAKIVVYPHADLAALEERLREERTGGSRGRRIILSESIFSMDGDVADVVGLARLAREYEAVLVLDEAHAVGAVGPQGRGVAAERGVIPDLLVGTFGKAFGSHGAFVAGGREPVEWLWNRARSLVFSTGLPPMISGATRRALELIRGEEGDARRARLAANALRLAAGLGLPEAPSHIIPWLIGADSAAVDASVRLMGQGYFAQAIRPPTVPEGTARLRLALGMHEANVVDGLAAAIRSL